MLGRGVGRFGSATEELNVKAAELYTDCDWLGLHVDALFASDARGRLLVRREPGRAPAPRFYLGRTVHGNLWRIRADEPTEAVRRLSRLAGREPALPRTSSRPPPPERSESIRRLLSERVAVAQAWRGPVYRFSDSARRLAIWRQQAVGTRSIEPDDSAAVALLRADFPQLADALGSGRLCRAVIEDGRARSVCLSRCGDASLGHEAVVVTLEEERERGLAARCLAAWALAVIERGAIPLYSTSWQSHTSQAVAHKLELEIYGENLYFE